VTPDNRADYGAHDVAGWGRIWKERQPDHSGRPNLADLLRADGYDTGFGTVTAEAWSAHVARWIGALGVTPDMSIFEVGCGAGAFLYSFNEIGCQVGGIDLSSGLLEVARLVMPEGCFRVGDAAELVGSETADIVLSSGVFQYFPSQRYARDVVRRMVGAARRAVLILDLPDHDRREQAEASRSAAFSDPVEYATRYKGLAHQYYRRSELVEWLTAEGCSPVVAEDVDIEGYANAPYRFNVYGMKVVPE
jgi:ubiquinone/menaquinone biosynthesis C-methylase UbiE